MAGWRGIIVLLAAVAVLPMQLTAEEAYNTVTVTCPDGYEMVGRSCYFISVDTHTGSSAHQYCKKNGGHAAVIESQEEMNLLKETVLNTTVYLGVNMQEYRRYQFQFALKMAGHTGFTSFGADEPDNYGSEDCVVADISDGLNWKDIHCTELHPVLCKAAVVVIEEEPSCGEGEHLFGGATCFWLDTNPNKSIAAQHQCRARGMELTSLHSQEEQDFLWGLNDGDHSFWTGLGDRAAEGVWKWSDGTPLDWQNWNAGEPDGGVGSAQNCVYMSSTTDGKWSDTYCHSEHSVACRGPAS